jgi:nondiscriminating glutamyl-tRNA synthetase
MLPTTTKAQTAQKPRVRFAPSPTGNLHIGGARTTLFNWLYARQTGGTFILRIEDTDRARSTAEYEKTILQDLRWLGLAWDEGVETGGEFGPYRQVERQEANIYQPFIKKLLDSGQAYYCYCTTEQLDQDRKVAAAAGKNPVYSGRCCNLTTTDRAAHERSGRLAVVRFKTPRKEVRFKDLVRGDVNIHGDDFGDFVIAKQDGSPLFYLANVIDDALMEISHVIRGEEHLPNTPKQILLAEALKLKVPQYAHLPLILNPDRSKMSKRAGPTHVREYIRLGYLPDAIINYVALLGWNPGTTQEILSRDELVKLFSIEKINKAGAVFDLTRLRWLNAVYLKKLSEKEYLEIAVPFVAVKADREKVERAIISVRERVQFLAELPPLVDFYFASKLVYEPTLLVWRKSTAQKSLNELERVTTAIADWGSAIFATRQKLLEALQAYVAENKLGTGDVFWPVRVALSGLKASPGPQDILWVLGKDEGVRRLREGIALLRKSLTDSSQK